MKEEIKITEEDIKNLNIIFKEEYEDFIKNFHNLPKEDQKQWIDRTNTLKKEIIKFNELMKASQEESTK